MKQPAPLLTLLALTFSFGAFLLSPVAEVAHAQESANQITITAIPPRVGDDNSLVIAPGKSKQVDLRVNNSSPNAVTIRSNTLDFIVGEDGETAIPVASNPESNRWSLSSWVVLTPAEQTIEAGETVTVRALITVPEDALPGGHYAMVVHLPNSGSLEEEGSDTTASQVSAVSQQVGTLLYAVVEGDVHEEAYVRDFSFRQFSEFGPVPFSYTVDNQSDIHIRPQVGIEIRNFFGKKVGMIQPESRNVFPYDSRSFEGEWDQIWGFGPYTAKLVMSFGEQGSVIVANSSFWIVPVKLVITVVLITLIIIAALISIRRHLIHRKTDQSARIRELEEQLKQVSNEEPKTE